MGGPTGYSIVSFGLMVECEPRMSIYAEALRRAVTPGCTVIDIGAGFGIFSMLAAKYGAGKVIAIEPDPASELVLPMAQANGCADRIEVVKELSTRYTPDSKADVIVSDIRGITPLFEHHIATIVDARKRLLAPGGTLLPMRDTMHVALVEAPKSYAPCVRPWLANNFGLDLSAAQGYVTNSLARAHMKADALLGPPQVFAELDYRTISGPDVDSAVELVADRPGTCHGLLVWFDAEIDEGLRFSNGPDGDELIYQQYFLAFERPVKLAVGDRAHVRIRVNQVDGAYIWSWDSDLWTGKGAAPDHRFRQSSFKSAIFSPERLRPHGHRQVPEPNPQIAVDRDCLALVGEGRSLQDIAEAVMERHPGHFDSDQAALGHVTKLLEGYRST